MAQANSRLTQMGIYPMEELTFVMRPAPEQSRYAGLICAEVRALSGVKILKTLAHHGFDNITIIEKYTCRSRGKSWKLLRIYADSVVCNQLHAACSPPDLEHVAKQTEKYLTAANKSTVIEAMKNAYTKEQLLVLADNVDLRSQQSLAKMTKEKLVIAIFSAAVKLREGQKLLVAQ